MLEDWGSRVREDKGRKNLENCNSIINKRHLKREKIKRKKNNENKN